MTDSGYARDGMTSVMDGHANRGDRSKIKPFGWAAHVIVHCLAFNFTLECIKPSISPGSVLVLGFDDILLARFVSDLVEATVDWNNIVSAQS